MTTKAATSRCSPEVCERAVRVVQGHVGEYAVRWAAVELIAPEIGCAAQTLHDWTKTAEVDGGKRAGVPADGAEELCALARTAAG